MSILRRITLILFGLLFITIVTIALLVPQALISIVTRIDPIPTPLRLLVVIVVDMIILALIYSLIRRRHSVNKGGLVVKSGGGNMLADVSTESALARVLKAVRDVPAVVSAEAKLDAIDGKADIDMDVLVDGDHINVPEKHKEIDQALRQVVIKQLGLQLANRPRVHIRLQGQDETVVPLTTPVPPLAEPLPPLPPPEPIVPVAAPLSAVPRDEASIGDEEVSSRYGLIGRRTEQVKAVVVEPEPVIESLPVVEPVPVVEPEPQFLGSWRTEDDTPLPSESIPVVESEPESSSTGFLSHWRTDEVTPLPSEPAVEPEPEPSSGGFLRHWRTDNVMTPPVDEPVEPGVVVEDAPVASSFATDPIGQELESLNHASDLVEEKGNLRVYNMPERDFSDATLLTPIPASPSEPDESFESSDADSTATPSMGLYDDIGESPEPDSDETDTLSKFP